MPTIEDIDVRTRDRMVTALKSELFTSMQSAADQLRLSDEGLQERQFVNLAPIGTRIVVAVEQETLDTLEPVVLNDMMAEAVDRAMNASISMADSLKPDGIFIACFNEDNELVRVTVVATIRRA
ncbi:MAG: hypothetical protein V4678_03195 [Patescibacteria group bacterium]